MDEGVMLLGSHHEVLFANASMRAMVKVGRYEEDGLRILDAFKKKFPTIELDKCLSGMTPGKPYLLPEIESDSEIYQVRFSCLAPEEQKRYGALELIWVENITGTKMLERRKSEFVSVVAHQLRTPLSGLKWTLHMLINGDLGSVSDEQKTFLLKSYENNQRMINLVNDLLAADRIESGRLKFNLLRINLRDLVENVLFELFPSAQQRGIHLDFKCPPDTRFMVLVDPTKMRAVLQNLLENAIKYTMKGGTVTITLEVSGTDARIVINDSGIGIPSDQQPQIFTRFFRAGNAVKTEPSGSGLGLYMVKKIVEEHGGKVWFESVEGKGSTFYVSIPFMKDNQ